MAKPRNSNNNSRVTVITDSNAKPANEKELAETIQALVNATRGANGTGDWDAGIDGANGSWAKYLMFWDARVSFEVTGSVEITFPFTVVSSVVRVIKCGTVNPVEVLYYVDKAKTLTLSGLNGRTVVELSMVKNTKEDI